MAWGVTRTDQGIKSGYKGESGRDDHCGERGGGIKEQSRRDFIEGETRMLGWGG